MRMSDLPPLERPREKALRYGVSSLSNHELLALLISCGYIDYSASDVAYQMLSESGGLLNLSLKTIHDLLSIKGIGESKAIRILSCFELAKRLERTRINNQIYLLTTESVFLKYRSMFSLCQKEHVYIVILDKKKRVLHEASLYLGTSREVNCSALEIAQQVIIHNGSCFYLLHNHPSGNYQPSEQDILFTTELINTSKKLGIMLLDHLIISEKGYFSFRNSSGLFWQKNFFKN